MKRIAIFFIILFLLARCGPGNEKKQKAADHSRTGALSSENEPAPERLQETGTISGKSGIQEGDPGFFKAGIKQIGNKRYGVYIVEAGDSVWVISEKVLRNYLKQEKFQKTDIGNWAYKINLANFATNFGGVKDELKIGDRILIPLD
ncbi:MAG: hypothetical protein PHF84_07920 [bacterium]|nr:hypothetical protein [bacterium]